MARARRRSCRAGPARWAHGRPGCVLIATVAESDLLDDLASLVVAAGRQGDRLRGRRPRQQHRQRTYARGHTSHGRLLGREGRGRAGCCTPCAFARTGVGGMNDALARTNSRFADTSVWSCCGNAQWRHAGVRFRAVSSRGSTAARIRNPSRHGHAHLVAGRAQAAVVPRQHAHVVGAPWHAGDHDRGPGDEATATSDRPGADPTATTYPAGRPIDDCHDRVTVRSTPTLACRFCGGEGGPVAGVTTTGTGARRAHATRVRRPHARHIAAGRNLCVELQRRGWHPGDLDIRTGNIDRRFDDCAEHRAGRQLPFEPHADPAVSACSAAAAPAACCTRRTDDDDHHPRPRSPLRCSERGRARSNVRREPEG